MKNFTENAAQTRENLRVLGDNLRSISKEIENCSYLLLENPNGSKSAPLAISILNMFASDCIELQKKILYIDGALKRVSEEMPECVASDVLDPIADERINLFISENIGSLSPAAGKFFVFLVNFLRNHDFPKFVAFQLSDILGALGVDDDSLPEIVHEVVSFKPRLPSESSDIKYPVGWGLVWKISVNVNTKVCTVVFAEQILDYFQKGSY